MRDPSSSSGSITQFSLEDGCLSPSLFRMGQKLKVREKRRRHRRYLERQRLAEKTLQATVLKKPAPKKKESAEKKATATD